MIQRIQTVYLLLIVVLSAFTIFAPVAGLIGTGDTIRYILNFNGISMIENSSATMVMNTWALSAISVIIPVVALVSIFLYKKRMLQIRLSIFNTVIMTGYYGLLFIYLWQASGSLKADWYLEIVSAFPLICIILNVLSIRAIGKDEALVKSLNRLR